MWIKLDTPATKIVIKDIVLNRVIRPGCNIDAVVVVLVVARRWLASVLARSKPANIMNKILLDDNVVSSCPKNSILAIGTVGAYFADVVEVVTRDIDKAACVLQINRYRPSGSASCHSIHLKPRDTNIGNTVAEGNAGGEPVLPVESCAPPVS